MSYGAPHCETIKTQAECGNCGHIEPEYYTQEEMMLNRLVEQTSAGYKECRAALEESGYDENRARRILDEKYLDSVCRQSASDGERFAQKMMNKPLNQVTSAGLQFLTLEAKNQLNN